MRPTDIPLRSSAFELCRLSEPVHGTGDVQPTEAKAYQHDTGRA